MLRTYRKEMPFRNSLFLRHIAEHARLRLIVASTHLPGRIKRSKQNGPGFSTLLAFQQHMSIKTLLEYGQPLSLQYPRLLSETISQ